MLHIASAMWFTVFLKYRFAIVYVYTIWHSSYRYYINIKIIVEEAMSDYIYLPALGDLLT